VYEVPISSTPPPPSLTVLRAQYVSARASRGVLQGVFYWPARVAIGGGTFIFFQKYFTKKLQAAKYGHIISIQKSSLIYGTDMAGIKVATAPAFSALTTRSPTLRSILSPLASARI
jgi:hypothetical protein